jgi:phage shock protein C
LQTGGHAARCVASGWAERRGEEHDAFRVQRIAQEGTMFADDLDRLAALHGNGKLSDEEFTRAKARVLDGKTAETADPVEPVAAFNRLRRSSANRWFAGVCGGLARSTGLEAWGWRLIFVLATLFAGGLGLLAYALLWIFVPRD